MSLLWMRPSHIEAQLPAEERRIRDFLASRGGVSETATSLSAKLDVKKNRCRHVLDQLTEEGLVARRAFSDMEPIYTRFPSR